MIDLHVGIPADEIARFTDDHEFVPVTDTDGNTPTKFTLEDTGRTSWEQWYEAPWVFDEDTDHETEEVGHHVVLRCASIASAIENFAWLVEEGFTLIPSRFESSPGTIGAVSDADDWAEQYLAFDTTHTHRWPNKAEFPPVTERRDRHTKAIEGAALSLEAGDLEAAGHFITQASNYLKGWA